MVTRFVKIVKNGYTIIEIIEAIIEFDANEILFWIGFAVFCMTIILVLIFIIVVVAKLLLFAFGQG